MASRQLYVLITVPSSRLRNLLNGLKRIRLSYAIFNPASQTRTPSSSASTKAIGKKYLTQISSIRWQTFKRQPMNGSRITTTSGPMNRSGAYRQPKSYHEDIMSKSLLMNCSLDREVYERSITQHNGSVLTTMNAPTWALAE